jgi:FKBP-type peptidyl-prolyl cis-trans isomerase
MIDRSIFMNYTICMKKLKKSEWVAVTVAIFVVGFFFIFGQNLIILLNSMNGGNTNDIKNMDTKGLNMVDTVLGTGETATPGARVTVNYVGKFTDGTVFDSSIARNEPFQFVLGAGQVIAGWDKGIVGMREGGSRILTVPASLGYGPNDYGPIPGGSTLVFEVQLLKVEK